MSLPIAVQNGLRPSPLITWLQDNSTTPEVLTGATITGVIRQPLTLGGVTRPITGTLVVTDGPNGVFRWDLSAADVVEAGNHEVQFEASFPSGQTPALTFATAWQVKPQL